MAQRQVGRRQFVTAVGVAAGVAASTGAARSVARAGGEPDEAPAADPAPTLAGLGAGTTIDRWTVEAVHAVRFGAVPVVLRAASGARFQVDVLRRDDAVPGVARTETLSLYLANRGNGATATDEEHGLGAMALANELARREAAGARLPALLSLRERREQHPLGGYSVLGTPA